MSGHAQREKEMPAHSPGERRVRAQRAPAPDVLSPADRYQELFVAVQQSRVFEDSKTFVDCAPVGEPSDILSAYRAQCEAADFDLAHFVRAHFRSLQPAPTDYESVPGQPIREHIARLWPVLTRHPDAHPPASSLLQLPHPYVVPGGRFGELYYWDSYFTMLGLAADGQDRLVGDMLENFAYLIDTYGHVPNGTRSYYLGRSQPPLFAFMVELAEAHGLARAVDHLPQLRQEHAWWMRDADGLAPGQASRRVVRLADGRLLNRFWDERDTPREESWLEDVTTARHAGREPQEVYRDLRAACESGWDFSTRWLQGAAPASAPAREDGGRRKAETAPSLASICTTDILPVDLNSFLYRLERDIAALAAQAGDAATADRFGRLAQARRDAIHALMWDEASGAYFDHDWKRAARRTCLTAACVVPLFAGLADDRRAAALADTVRRRLVAPGGLATTERASDQQWDRPNGWAPLQWMAVQGLRRHGHNELADTIAHRWLCTVAAIYEREGKLIEKYALRAVDNEATRGGLGGEYPLQDGFGWTNGVAAALLALHPSHSARDCRARLPTGQHR
ncbi:alpha,alpha-trehalase [Variovorax defluvii]|uniref:Alpha,alpha-trehalase n=1 Tax=Variovorax defluvii TaxID=913761 RepID=A0ABP8I669_9BURK